MKIVYVLIHHAPYKDPLINQLKSNRNIDFSLLTLYPNPTTHKEWHLGYDSDPNFSVVSIPLLGDIHLGVIKQLKSEKPDLVIVSGYYPIVNLLVVQYCVMHNIKYVYGCDTVNKSRLFVGNMFQKAIIKHCSALFINGRKSEIYLDSLRIKDKKRIRGFYCLDILAERELYEKHKEERNNIRNSMGFSSDDFIFLFVGKLIKSRRIYDFLSINNNKLLERVKFLIVGDGLEAEEIDKLMLPRVTRIGSSSYNELYKYYAAADGYFHPGSEPYSLALTQAVIAELPVITSYDVGAAMDFVIDEVNGYIINDDDLSKYADKMNELSEGKDFSFGLKSMFLLLKEQWQIERISEQISSVGAE